MEFWPFYTVGVSLVLVLIFLGGLRAWCHRHRVGREVRQLVTQQQYEYLIVDTRSEEAFRKSHVPGAVRIPLHGIENHLPTEKMFQPIYVFGETHRLAASSARILSDTGYFNVQYFGAFRRWKGPVEMSS